MTFSYVNFIKPLTEFDKNLKIYDIFGNMIYTISPISIVGVSILNNNIKISKNNKTFINIPISNNIDIALENIQTRINILNNETPIFLGTYSNTYTDNNINNKYEYSYETFIKPLTDSDRNLKIYDKLGNIIYTISPLSIIDISILNNNIKITKSNKTSINIPINNNIDTALEIIQQQLYILSNLEIPTYTDTYSVNKLTNFAIYNYETFVKPLTDSDRNIKIYNSNGDITNTINPYSIINTNVSSNILNINVQDKVISLFFSSSNESQLALSKIQGQIVLLVNKTPLVIDKGIKNYINDFSATGSGDSKFTGSIPVILANGKSAGPYLNGDTFTYSEANTIDLIKKLLQEVVYPTFTEPKLSLSLSDYSICEVGEVYSTLLTATFDRGRINGKMINNLWNTNELQNYRAGLSDNYIIDGFTQLNNSDVATLQVTKTITLGDNVFTGYVNFNDGAQPKDSINNDYLSKYLGGSLSNSVKIVGRKKLFHGVNLFTPSNSSEVRSLSNFIFDNITSFNILISTTKYIIAIPDDKNITSIISSNGESLINNLILTIVSVEDAGSSLSNYKIYTYNSAIPLNLSAIVTIL